MIRTISISKPYSDILFSVGVSCILAGLVFYRGFISIGMVISIIAFVCSKDKWYSVIQNRPIQTMISFYIILLFGGVYSENISYYLKDISIKLPLIVYPIIFSTYFSVISSKIRTYYMVLFCCCCVTACLYNYIRFLLIGNHFLDIREHSYFVSHIRFSLMLCLCVVFGKYFVQNTTIYIYKIASLFMIFVFVSYMIYFQLATGLCILLCIIFGYNVYYISQQKHLKYKLIHTSILSIGICSLFLFISFCIKDFYHVHPIDLDTLEKQTVYGNPYTHDTTSYETDNGYYVHIYVCEKELEDTWNTLSSTPYHSINKKQTPISHTVKRYLTSKGLRKDRNGLLNLTKQDIAYIEHGIPTIREIELSPIRKKIDEILYQIRSYTNTGNIELGHSLLQRLFFMKTALDVTQHNILFGLGTGDVEDALKTYYTEVAGIDSKYHLKTHNQYLSTYVSLGVFGLLIFICSLCVPVLYAIQQHNYLYIIFCCILLLSFLTEDTLETQVGCALYAIFNCFLFFTNVRNKRNISIR